MRPMSTISNLESIAVTAAKKGQWNDALQANMNIIHDYPDDISALNRAGFACLQLHEIDRAIEYFKHVLEIEKSNTIAIKQLENIRHDHIKTPQFEAENFIEEPSKSKIVTLLRLTSKEVLETLNVGQELVLRPKGRFISVETADKVYLGSLPEDISLRLSYLIEHGNQYLCQLHTATAKHCSVYIKEIYQDPANRNYHSFISNFQPGKDDTIGEDLLLLADESPLNVDDDDHDDTETDE